MEENRPNPDDLLKSIQKEEERENKGKLRIFFGMCAGVGKTYAMLEAAQEQRRGGVNVAVGVVETHGRQETQRLLEGLYLIPKKRLEYKGTSLEEMDLERIIVEKPALVLVDELAHTNVPGSRHAKRWQDVEEILGTGIDVYTTVNVQHLESRSELVGKITGIVVRETVPDTILELADQIELIDIPPRDLLKRLKEGKVYLGERAEVAAINFFKEETLSALREMALRFTAEKVDEELRSQMTVKRILGPWNANERLLVAVSHSPHSAALIRRTRRKAFTLGAPWVGLYVDTGQNLSDEDRKRLHKNLALAKELGAELITTSDSNVANAINRVCLEKNVTQLVLGRPDRRMTDLFTHGNILDQLIHEMSDVDIHVVRMAKKSRFRGLGVLLPKKRAPLSDYVWVLGAFVATSAVCLLFLPYIGYRAVGYVYMAAVLFTSILTSFGPIMFAATFSAFTWNFFFIPPLYTFVISSTEDMMMIAAYYFAAIVAGVLTARIKKQDDNLRLRELRSNVLYELGKDLSEAKNPQEIVSVTVKCIETLFPVKVSVFPSLPNNQLSREPLIAGNAVPDEKDYAVAFWAFTKNKKAGWNTDTLQSSRCMCVPLCGKEQMIGVLLVYPEKDVPFLLEEEVLLDTISSQLAMALEREVLDAQAKAARLLEESERLHQTLLNSVSHELRTPVTSIMGYATALQDAGVADNPMIRLSISEELIDASERLNHIIGNLLDMSRLSGGLLTLKREAFDANELVRATVSSLARPLRSHKMVLRLDERELYCEGDFRFLEHAVANIVLNAAYYSSSETTIEIATFMRNGTACISVKDEGRGIPEESIGRIFDKFYRVPGTPAGGTGLGLSVVKNILEAHKGCVSVANRHDRQGAIFTLELPLAKLPREITED